jgi:hypothetical protein
MANDLFGLSLPQVCCSCLGRAEVMHEVSSFYGEGGKSIEAKFDVPMCLECRSRMRTRERIAYAIAFGSLAVAGLFLSPYAPVSAAVRGWLTGPAAVVLALAFLAFLFIGLGRPFEPAKYSQGSPRFSNQEYQRLFEEANDHPEASRGPAGIGA